MMENFIKSNQYINCNGRLLDLNTPKIMGILNITPDSFFDGGKYQEEDTILKRVQDMLADGADIIDIGAYSSRPGAVHISTEEELNRLAKALNIIRKAYPEVIISVDTFRAKIAEAVVKDFQVDIINDIAAGEMDEKMFDTMVDLNVPYIIMHMKGTPQDMQNDPNYNYDVVYEIIDYFSKKVEELKQRGLHDIILDPGFGFGKTLDHNYELLNRMKELDVFELPVLIGLSRKSMIYNLLDCTPKEALNGTSLLNMISLQNGASILRVHDVKEARECVAIYNKLQSVK
ncbi:dihydropteroate synthase [Plebeiibacterium sediminum]|uniref:Dihydropteroate synthase n=1 Tax=Plebeiibacterium sediminum TaxID=2992112 RepID=A0AAE3M463_9BACT|nr:dihydropteroate synthase [Plebeiobacterium sediminum]MCW3786941.1 dihydropteroate synthase [Plebeiobacterium sediminum]